MNAKDINMTYDLHALVQGDTDLKSAGKYYIGPCPFCGGKDRFNLKQTPDGWRWLCRNCTEARYKSPIDYIMRRDDLDFKQALETLRGKSAAPAPRPRAEISTPVPIAIVLPDATWQAQRWHEITQATDALLSNKPARAYLESRAFDPAIWNTYLLGFEMAFDPKTQMRRPAISIPWYDTDETITAIKYRFIDDLAKDKSHRYTMAKGSKQILFGLHMASGNETLILVEGEFNSMSITRVSTGDLLHVDALSFGSETATNADILRAVADDYQRVIIWADDPAHANTIRLSLARPAEAICSPEISGVKYDANTLLQNRHLAQFLLETIKDPSHA
jgi:DNA primase